MIPGYLAFFFESGCRDPDPQVPVGLGTGAGLSLPVGGVATEEPALLEFLFILLLTGGWDLGRGTSLASASFGSGAVGLDVLMGGLVSGGGPFRLEPDSLALGAKSGLLRVVKALPTTLRKLGCTLLVKSGMGGSFMESWLIFLWLSSGSLWITCMGPGQAATVGVSV